MRILIAVITYRRPEPLRLTLKSLEAAVRESERAGNPARVVVIDNDPRLSAAAVCADFEWIAYQSEARPGIPAARNKALNARRRGEWLAFVDDDEVAAEDWLVQLARHADATEAHAVFGPVLPILPSTAPRWMVRGGFFDRSVHQTGDQPRHPATNNVLIAPALFELADGRCFDERFAATGGSDTEFFVRMARAGARYSYCAEAKVSEIVPDSRASVRWLWRRNVRLGNMTTRIRFAGRRRIVPFTLGVARIAYGTIVGLFHFLSRGHPIARSAQHVPRGVGMIGAALGTHYNEYGRPTEGSEIGAPSQ